MEKTLLPYQRLKIQLEEIISATNNFNDEKNYIGGGGFGKVYKGEVSHSKGRSMVAIKRLDPKNGQGLPEFLKEITMLSDYRHENLISLLGFCDEGREMILVYELASHGSLDIHLDSPHLTWIQRLKICLDAAKGLSYLHDPRETHQRLIHCDMKSANILLDDQWNAKVSDFGLSLMAPANEQRSMIVTLAVGTLGYCDPQYAMTNTLTKESDVYSLGVVLVEVLCGRLCYRYSINGDGGKKLVPTWIESYKQKKKLDDITFKSPIIQPLDQLSLKTFSDIAYRCLNESREDRPKMSEVVTELEVALETQEFSEWKPLFDYQGMNKTAEPPVNYSSNGELRKLLSKGVLLNGGKTCFSLNKKGEHCEMISFAECLDLGPSEFERCPWASQYNSRFAVGAYPYKNLRDEIHEETNPDGDSRCVQCSLITYAVNHVSKVVLPKKVPRRHSEPWILKTRVKTQFLSPGITYGVNLVFKFMHPRDTKKGRVLITLKYRLQGETKTSISHFAVQREDGWYMAELYQLISEQRIVDHKIWFVGFFDDYEVINVEGIEFSPLEQMEHTDDKHPISNSDANWEINMPADYEDIMKWSTNSLHWTTKKEAYSVIRKGFLINDDGKKWFFLDENGKKCHMISAKGGGDFGEFDRMLPFPDSRFGEALVLAISRRYEINCKTQSQLVSSETTYAGYLVYKLPKHQSGYEAPMQVRKGQDESYVYLKHPDTPFIRPKTHKKPHNPLNRPKLKGFPQQRIDGWMEVQICDFRTTTTTTDVMPIHIFLTSSNPMMSLFGLIIEGIEFRPI